MTKQLALQLFPGADFFAPLQLSEGQDLVDVEDLFLMRTYVMKSGRIHPANYTVTQPFFRATYLTANRGLFLDQGKELLTKLVDLEFQLRNGSGIGHAKLSTRISLLFGELNMSYCLDDRT